MPLLRRIVGPRVSPEELALHPGRYRAPGAVFWLARLLLLVSIFLPYWEMDLRAPQYPDGLHLTAHVNRLSGDVKEIDTLNHYIGMRPLEQAATFERATAVGVIIAFMLLVEGATLLHTRWAALLVAPAIAFPYFFFIDLHLWMSYFGTNLDPAAPLSSAIEPFVPPVIGHGAVGQFQTHAYPGSGWWLAAAMSVLCVAGLWLHRRAYRPLVVASAGVGGTAEDAARGAAA